MGVFYKILQVTKEEENALGIGKRMKKLRKPKERDINAPEKVNEVGGYSREATP